MGIQKLSVNYARMKGRYRNAAIAVAVVILIAFYLPKWKLKNPLAETRGFFNVVKSDLFVLRDIFQKSYFSALELMILNRVLYTIC